MSFSNLLISNRGNSRLGGLKSRGVFSNRWFKDIVITPGDTSLVLIKVSTNTPIMGSTTIIVAPTGIDTGTTTLSAYGTDTSAITATITEGVAPDTWDIAFSGGGYDGSTATITEAQRLALLPASGGVPLMVVPPLDTEAPVGTHTIRPALWLAPEDDPGVFTSKVYRNGTIEVTTGDGYTYVETASDDGRSLTHRSLASNIAGDGAQFALELQAGDVYVPQPVAVNGSEYFLKVADVRPDVNSLVHMYSFVLTAPEFGLGDVFMRIGEDSTKFMYFATSGTSPDIRKFGFFLKTAQGNQYNSEALGNDTSVGPQQNDKVVIIWTQGNAAAGGKLGSHMYLFVNGVLVDSNFMGGTIPDTDTFSVSGKFGIFAQTGGFNRLDSVGFNRVAMWTDVVPPDFSDPNVSVEFVASNGDATPQAWANGYLGASPVVLFDGGSTGFNGVNQGTWGDVFPRTGTFTDV